MPSNINARRFKRAALFAGLFLVLVSTDPAFAGDDIFGTDSPLVAFVEFITGPFAYAVVIMALVGTVGVLALGGEFSGFARRLPIIVVAGAIVILAETVLTNLFGGNRAYTLPPDIMVEPLPKMQQTGASAFVSAEATVPPVGSGQAD